MQDQKHYDTIPGWNGARYEKKPVESGADILLDQRRVPTVWSRITAGKADDGKGNPIPPEVTVYFDQPKIGSSSNFGGKNGVDMGHAMLGIDYSRYSYETSRYERYAMKYGFYMAGGFIDTSAQNAMANRNALVPGTLHDDWGHKYTVSRRYPARPDQVNSIVKASETYADGGYGYYKRNCTTFVKEMVVDVANLDTGGTIFEKEDVRYTFKNNALRTLANTGNLLVYPQFRKKMAELSSREDLSYQGYGNKRVTKADLENFNKSDNIFNLSVKTYIPAVSAENARRLRGKNSGYLGSYSYVPQAMGKSVEEISVNSQILSEKIGDEIINLISAIEQNVVAKTQSNELPPAINNVISHLYILNGRGIMTLDADLARTALQKNKDLSKDTAAQILEPDSFRLAHAQMKADMEKLSNLYQDFFKNDEQLFIPFSKILSLYQVGLNYLNNCYAEASRANLVQSELGNIRQEMRDNVYTFESAHGNVNMTPSQFESYVQIFGSGREAIDKYARYKSLKGRHKSEVKKAKLADDDEDDNIINNGPELTEAEKKEFKELSLLNDLARDLDRSHNYLLEKQNYSQQDIDYIFSLSVKSKAGLNTNRVRMFRRNKSSADVYQSLLLERIFKGFRADFYNKGEGGFSEEAEKNLRENATLEHMAPLINWLDNYLTNKASSQQDFLKMILRGIFRSEEGQNREKLLSSIQSMLYDNYIGKIFTGGAGDARAYIGTRFFEGALVNMFNKRDSGFTKLITKLSDEVIQESGNAAGGNVPAQQPGGNVPAQQPGGNAPAQQPAGNVPAQQAQAPAAEPIRGTATEVKEQLKQAGKVYGKFLERQKKDGFYTKKQLEERRKQFLDNYYGLCEDYCKLLNGKHIWSNLPQEAYTLIVHVALAHPGSYVQQAMQERGAILAPGKNKAGNQAKQEIDLKATVETTHEKRMAELAVDEDPDHHIHEGDIPESDIQKGMKKGVSELQINGIRSICAYLYLHTKEHAALVESIDNRAPREKLLIFYIVEKDKKNGLTPAEVMESQTNYVPSVTAFKEKIYYRKHWYKMGATNINWNLISDASSMAYSMRDMLGNIGNGRLPGEAPVNVPAENPKIAIADERKSILNKPLIDIDEPIKKEVKNDINIINTEKSPAKKSDLLSEDEKDDQKSLHLKEAKRKVDGILFINNIIQQSINKSKPGSGNEDDLLIKENDNNLIKSNASLDDLQDRIQDMYDYLKDNNLVEDPVPNTEGNDGKAPGKATGFNKFGNNTQDVNKYFTLLHTFCGTELKLLKALKTDNVLDFSKGISGLQWESMGGDAASALMNVVLLIVNFRNALNSFGTERWEETAMKAISFFQSLGNTAKSGFTATTGTAGLVFNADWGMNGASETAKSLTTAAAYGGIALGGLTAGIGLGNMVVAGVRRSRATDVENKLKDAPKDKAFEGKRQILKNVITANRAAQKRTQGSAAMQMVQGGLNTASGVLALGAGATLGLGGIAALGLSGAALLVNIGNMIYQKKSKSREMKDVIDCYLNMNKLLSEFMNKNMKNKSKKEQDRIRQKFGTQEEIRDMIRKEAEALLGYPSDKKMYSAIMWKYANTLFDMVFKKDGRYITEQERASESLNNRRMANERKLYADMLKAYGFKIKYPAQDGAEPKPALNSIYKKLTA